MWHLGTPISGTLKDKDLTALELALAAHPTPAICGTPAEAAQALIETAETDRGFYAGAVGWCDSSGDGSTWWPSAARKWPAMDFPRVLGPAVAS